MVTFADCGAARGIHETYQYEVGDMPFHFAVEDGAIELRYGRAAAPAVTITTDEDTWGRMA